jgi:3D (Asp-Asp-Asp) domain-containing protein
MSGSGKHNVELSSTDFILAQSSLSAYYSQQNFHLPTQISGTAWPFGFMDSNKGEYNKSEFCTITAKGRGHSAPNLLQMKSMHHAKSRHPQEAISAFQQIVEDRPEKANKIRLGEFMLTAYTVDFQSTGKEPSAPDFGITFCGSRARVGRTVAVDPTVIPIGTPIYIEGIGWRLAEDIGSAVKGKHIDVLLSTERMATEFGVKRHVTVYTIDGMH